MSRSSATSRVRSSTRFLGLDCEAREEKKSAAQAAAKAKPLRIAEITGKSKKRSQNPVDKPVDNLFIAHNHARIVPPPYNPPYFPGIDLILLLGGLWITLLHTRPRALARAPPPPPQGAVWHAGKVRLADGSGERW